MKKQLFNWMAYSAISVMLVSCKEGANDFPKMEVIPVQASSFLEQYGPQEQTFTFDASAPFQIVGEKGMTIAFSSNPFVDSSGQFVDGLVTVTLKELRSKSDIVFSGVSTESNGHLLETGGEFYIEVEKNGEQLYLDPDPWAISAYVQFPKLNGENGFNMELFEAVPSVQDPERLTWIGVNDTTMFSFGNSYDFELPNLSWVNIDRFYAYSGPKTDISVNLAGSLVEGNAYTEVWVVFKDLNIVFALPGNTTVGTDYDEIFPVGEDVILAAFGQDSGGNLHLGTKEITTQPNQTYTINLSPANDQQVASLIQYLNE